MERRPLIEVCRDLLAPARAEVFAVQVARVLSCISSEERLAEIGQAQDVIRAFESKGLIPPLLVYLCRPFFNEPGFSIGPAHAEILALSFAACAYPQRPYRMADREIRMRLESFARFYWRALSFDSMSPQYLSRLLANANLPCGLVEYFSADEIGPLASDLCAGESVARLEHDEGQRRREDRIAGAILYLATCYPAMIRRTRELWGGEADFVRYFRTYIHTSPSDITSEGDATHPDWRRVRSQLASKFPDQPPGMHDQAIMVEQATRNCMIEYTPVTELTNRVALFWQLHWDKLISGFPYYAFRSRFVYWWKKCVATYKPPPILEEFNDETEAKISRRAHSTVSPAHSELTPEELQAHREGYRLVRATFFRREDRKKSGANIPVDDAYENERLRMALDQIWFHHIQTLPDEDIPRLSVKQIIERQPFLNETTVYVLTRRIKLRIWAYTLARFDRLSNDRVRSAKKVFGRGKDETPLEREPGVETIASLARMIPWNQTMLWAFTAHIFLHPKVLPQRPSPLQFRDYIRELWWWVMADTFDEAIKRGAGSGSASFKAALRALHRKAFEQIIESLRKLNVERELDLYLSDRDFTEERSEAIRLVDGLLGSDDVYKNFEQRARNWRARAAQHWIVPVWYLKHVEGVRKEELLPRLIADQREALSIVELYQAMTGLP